MHNKYIPDILYVHLVKIYHCKLFMDWETKAWLWWHYNESDIWNYSESAILVFCFNFCFLYCITHLYFKETFTISHQHVLFTTDPLRSTRHAQQIHGRILPQLRCQSLYRQAMLQISMKITQYPWFISINIQMWVLEHVKKHVFWPNHLTIMPATWLTYGMSCVFIS